MKSGARAAGWALSVTVSLGTAWAQAPVPPPAAAAKAPEAPAIKLGATLFTDFTYQIAKSEFEVRRAYLNVTGAVSDFISFRITPDVAARQSTTVAGTGLPSDLKVASSLDGSLTIRLKYAFAQVGFDTLGPRGKGAWIRVGQQQTPYVDFMEGIYRYRFQGTVFAERQGLLSSSDVGISGHYNLPADFGDVHVGLYNGETYTKAEVNGQKAFQVRGSLRPIPRHDIVKGLRLHAFYDRDAPTAGGARRRLAGGATFEHRRLNLGAECIRAADKASGLASATEVRSSGCSAWVNPRLTGGLEALFRYDRYTPNRTVHGSKREVIAGAGYWFPVLKAPQAASLLADYDAIDYDAALGRPDERRWELKALLSF